jgi:WD40 repeat protein
MFPNHFAVAYKNDILIYDSQFNKQYEFRKMHVDFVWCLLQLRDGRIASGSNDGSIRIWNEDGTSIEWERCTNRKREGYPDGVLCLLQLQDGRIASGSDVILVWNFDGSFVEWKGHTGCITCLIQLQDGRIASGSGDQTIRIWNEDGSSIQWKGHASTVYCLLQLEDGRIASGSHDDTIRIWKRADASGDEDGSSIEWRYASSVRCLLQLHDGRIVLGLYDGTIHIWNLDGTSIELKCTGVVHDLLQLQDGRIASVSYKTIRIWNEDWRSTNSVWRLLQTLTWGSSSDRYSPIVCEECHCIVPIYTKEDLQKGRRLVYELLANYIIEDVKYIVYQYVKPL